MDKETFEKAMIGAGREAMLAKIAEIFGPVGTRSAARLTTPALAELMWGIHRCCAK